MYRKRREPGTYSFGFWDPSGPSLSRLSSDSLLSASGIFTSVRWRDPETGSREGGAACERKRRGGATEVPASFKRRSDLRIYC
jgi:hypothetical protein